MSKSDLAEQRRLEAIRDAKTTLELLSPEPTAVGRQRCDDALVSSISLLRTLGRDDEVVHVAIAELEFVRSAFVEQAEIAQAIVAAEGDDVEWFHPDEVARMIATALEAKEVELAEARSGNRYAQLERLAIKRAELAEAALAEALKALEETDRILRDIERHETTRVVDAQDRISIARRALTGGKEDG